MGEGIVGGYASDTGIDTDRLPVVVHGSCYDRCRKLFDKLDDLIATADDRQTDELALICEGKGFLRPCKGIVVRTEEACSVVAGPFFGQSNTEERKLFRFALNQNSVIPVGEAFNMVQK